MQFLLMCRSLTYAQRSARVLERAGIAGSVMRAPKSVSARGCAYCVAVPEKNGARAVKILTESGMKPEKIYRRGADGSIGEAAL